MSTLIGLMALAFAHYRRKGSRAGDAPAGLAAGREL